jgi:homoserine O-succinyltransferase
MESDEVGLCLIADAPHRALYMFNHIEYDTATLAEEYWRDVGAKRAIALPRNYFPGDDPNAAPENRWRSHAHLLFGNWINEVYQTTPYDLRGIGR